MTSPEGIRFRPPSENHAAPLGIKPSATPPAEQGFTDRALDAYTLQELLDLRAVEAKDDVAILQCWKERFT